MHPNSQTTRKTSTHCFKFRRIFRQIDVVRRGTSVNIPVFFSGASVRFFMVAFRVQHKFPVRIFHDMFCFRRSVESFCRRTVWNTALESYWKDKSNDIKTFPTKIIHEKTQSDSNARSPVPGDIYLINFTTESYELLQNKAKKFKV